ncbi:MAG: TRAP transporter small permease subunit [Pseudomonadota bacterium]
MRELSQIADGIDRINGVAGRLVMGLALAMALAQGAVVLLRYVFAIGFIPLQESIWFMNGILFLVGAGFTLARDRHVRVDLFYRGATERQKALVDLAGALVLLLPFCVLTFVLAVPYVATSWAVLERSREVAGLPGIFLLKSIILVFAVLLGLQAIALAIRTVLRIRESDGEGHGNP